MDSLQRMREIRRIYDDYLEVTERLGKNRKAADGLLGFGRGPDSDPCHDRFAERLEQALDAFASDAPASGDIAEVLRFIYDKPPAHKNNNLAYWMMVAVQSLTEKLIGGLLPEEAANVAARFTEAYPKAMRLPSQKKIAGLLLAQSGAAVPRKKHILLDIFGGHGRKR